MITIKLDVTKLQKNRFHNGKKGASMPTLS